MSRFFFSLFIISLILNVKGFENQIKFEFFYGLAFDPQIIVFDINEIANVVNHFGFRSNGRTVIFHFDEEDYDRQQQVTEILTSYLYSGSYNIIMVIYDNPSVISDENALALSEVVAEAMRRIFANNYQANLMNLLGKGVGANILSQAGSRVIQNGHAVNRLTSLNPTRLQVAAAIFMDTVFTEGYVEGDRSNFGHANFVVNGGVHSQPGCGGQSERCSREFAMRVWSESVRSVTQIFPCLRCDTWQLFLNGECNTNVVGHLGLQASPGTFGLFMVQTNTRDPWSRSTALPRD